MANTEKLCLQWNDFKNNASTAFQNMREDRDLSDVTLACEDGHQLEAHKVILASSSPFFMDLLKRNKHPHPLVYMKGIRFVDLTAMIDFLYSGEANIFQDDLDAFLALAEELRLEGLAGSGEKIEGFGKPPEIKATLEELSATQAVPMERSKTKERENTYETTIAVNRYAVDASIEDVEEKIESMITVTEKSNGRGRLVQCNACGKESQRLDIVRHIEAKHITGVSYSCAICGQISRSRNALRQHRDYQHKGKIFQESRGSSAAQV